MNNGNRKSDESLQTRGKRENIRKAEKDEEGYKNQCPWGAVNLQQVLEGPGRAGQGPEEPGRSVRDGQGQEGPARAKGEVRNPRRARQSPKGQVRMAEMAKRACDPQVRHPEIPGEPLSLARSAGEERPAAVSRGSNVRSTIVGGRGAAWSR